MTTSIDLRAVRVVAALLVALMLGVESPAIAQQLTLLTGHDGSPLLDVERPSLSRDGRTVLVFANGQRVDASLPDATHLLVLRSGQTTPVFAQLPADPGVYEGRLSSDGNHLVYRGRFSTGYTVVVRRLDTANERTVHATIGRPVPTVVDISESGADVVVLETDFAPSTRLLVRSDAPAAAVAMVPPCTSSVPQADAAATSEISADGSTVAFLSLTGVQKGIIRHHAHAVGNASTGAAECLRLADPRVYPYPRVVGHRISLSRNGRFVAGTAAPVDLNEISRAFVLDRGTGAVHLLGQEFLQSHTHGLSEDGRFVLITAQPHAGLPARVYVVDRVAGITTDVSGSASIPFLGTHFELSGDGSTVLFQTASLPEGRRTYLAKLDVDGDGLHDAWETAFGLNPSDAADASLDADGDGRTNAQEYAAGTHPNGTPVRYFAEGAQGTFFNTSLALFNPAATAATVNVRFLGPDGASAVRLVTLAAHSPGYLDASSLGLPFSEFSIVIDSPTPVVAERRMTWGTQPAIGTHAGTGAPAPASTWHFAEGATIAGIQTFFLLQNPGPTPAVTTMRYLPGDGTTQERTHVVPAQSRLTIWANQEGAPMNGAEFATTVTSDQPLVAERAMYRDAGGLMFAAGSVVSGVATPATSWFLAEGATGTFFDTFLLLSNPGDAAATVDVEFIRAHDVRDITTAMPVQRQYVLPPRSRRTIWVRQEDAALQNTQVGVRLQSTAPIVAERSMWWPGPTSATWREMHADTGATVSGRMWGVADIQADVTPGGWDTFLLVATTEQYLARIRVAVACDDGTTVSRDSSISVNRTTLWMRHVFPEMLGKRCAATIESLPSRITSSPTVPLTRVPLVVEKAMYYGTDFTAGSVSLATRLPDPVDQP